MLGTSLAVQWLEPCSSMASIPDHGTKIPQEAKIKQKKQNKTKQKTSAKIILKNNLEILYEVELLHT